MWGAITGAITGGITSTHYFVEGTPVQTMNGETPIEEIQVGDYVLTENEDTGDVTYKQVLNTFVNEDYNLVHLIIDGQRITCTEGHKFYVADKGWIIAKELAINDRLVSSNGREKQVEYKSLQQLHTPVKVYNFEVENYHTYFVGNGILVHNSDCGINGSNSSGLYSDLADSKSVGAGKKFTATQKKKILQSNMDRNGGVIKSDLSGEVLVPATKSQKCVTPSSKEVHIDHVKTRSKGGSNSYSNAQVLSRIENLLKSNK